MIDSLSNSSAIPSFERKLDPHLHSHCSLTLEADETSNKHLLEAHWVEIDRLTERIEQKCVGLANKHSCIRCVFFNGGSFLSCAVHPEEVSVGCFKANDCVDWEAKPAATSKDLNLGTR